MNLNIFAIIMLALLVFKIVMGFKKGSVAQIVSLISLIFLCVIAVLVGHGILSYLDGEYLAVGVILFLLSLLGVVHHVLNLVLFPAKLIAKLPIAHGVDKLLGAALGAAETVLILWVVYYFAMMPESGETGKMILQYAAENPVLTWFFDHNQLLVWIEPLGLKFDKDFKLPSISITIKK